MIGELIYSVEVAIVRCPGDGEDGAAAGPVEKPVTVRYCDICRRWGATGTHAHVLAQLAAAPVGPPLGDDAGRAAMRIYIAARYDRRFEMLGVAAALMRAGHDVTSRLDRRRTGRRSGDRAGGRGSRSIWPARIAWSLSPRSQVATSPGRRGAGDTSSSASRSQRGKRLCIVGPRENIFHHLLAVEAYATVADLIAGLTLARCRRDGLERDAGARAVSLLRHLRRPAGVRSETGRAGADA